MVTALGGDLPVLIGGGQAQSVPLSDVDVMIDNVPFWLAVSKDAPYQRETAPYQRDQVDQQPEAGEQSLAGWWTRSQMSFHAGAGLDYLDSTSRPDESDRIRFATSRGVDVWTPGKVCRLPASLLARASVTAGRVWAEVADVAGVTTIIIARPAGVERSVDGGATWTTVDYGSAFPVRAFCVDGVNYYAATIDGIFVGPVSGASAGVKVWELPDTDVTMCLGWVKQRLMFGHGRDVYALEGTGAALPLPTPKMTHPTEGWGWSAFADSPSGILACGYAGLSSGIYKFELEDVEGAPTLGAGIALLSMPGGERILAAQQYLGSLLVIGTSRGMRVCPFDSYYGTISLGPLSVENTGTYAVGGYDRFVWGGVLDDGSSLVRLDLGQPLDQQGHYAWAPDLLPPGPASGAPTAIAFLPDGRKVWAVNGYGILVEQTTPYVGDAYLQTARIRVGTVEDKHFSFGTVRGRIATGAGVQVWARTAPTADWKLVHSATTNGERFGLRQPPAEWVELQFHLDSGASLGSYQVQALPAGPRQRLVSLPVWVGDEQTTKQQRRLGFPGWGLERLSAVEHIEETGVPVTVAAPALFPESFQAVIEKLTYVQEVSSGRGGTGGRLQIVVRAIG